jgi:hypothetical protein
MAPLKRQSCQLSDDSNAHISLCPSHSIQLSQVLTLHKSILIDLLEEHTTTFTYDLRNRINNSLLFNLPHTSLDNTDPLSISHPSLLLLYNLIPTELTSLFYNYIGNSSLRNKILLQFLKPISKALNDITWKLHQHDLKRWEKSLRITKNKKKFYKRLKLTANTITRQQRRPRSERLTMKLYDATRFSPYYKSHFMLDQTAHIRWTSSNFLHSGSWESHRDTLLFSNIDLFSDLQTFINNLSHIT